MIISVTVWQKPKRSMSDLREQVLRQQLAKQRQTILIVGLVCMVLGLCLLLVYLYRRRQRLLLEKEEEIETLRNMLASADKPDDRFRNNRSSESEIRTGASQPADGSVRKLMLQQLGVIKTIAGTPTEANQQLLARLMALELQLCCLLKADFTTKEINMLTRQSLQTIYQRKTQVRQKLSLAEAEDITTAIL